MDFNAEFMFQDDDKSKDPDGPLNNQEITHLENKDLISNEQFAQRIIIIPFRKKTFSFSSIPNLPLVNDKMVKYTFSSPEWFDKELGHSFSSKYKMLLVAVKEDHDKDLFVFDLTTLNDLDVFFLDEKEANHLKAFQIEKETDKIILMFIFVIYQKTKPRLKIFNNLLIDIQQAYSNRLERTFKNFESIRYLITFINIFYKSENQKYLSNSLTIMCTCLLGCIEVYIQQNVTLPSELIIDLIDCLSSNRLDTVYEFKHISSFFLNGLSCSLIFCIMDKDLVGYFIPLLHSIINLPDFQLESKIDKFCDARVFITGSFLTQPRKHGMKILLEKYSTLDQLKIFGISLDLCVDLEGIFGFIEIFSTFLDENEIRDALDSRKTKLLNNRVFKETVKPIGLKNQYNELLTHKNYFQAEYTSIIVYFIEKVEENSFQIQLIKELNIENVSEVSLWTKVVNKITNNINKYSIHELVELIEQFANVCSSHEYFEKVKLGFKNEILSKIQADPDIHSDSKHKLIIR